MSRGAILQAAAALALVVLAGAGAAHSTTVAAPQGTIVFPNDRTGISQIYSVRADGTRLGQLTRGSGAATEPSFSPDGRRILFTRRFDAWVMNADGSRQRDLGFFHSNSAWAPDSKRLAYSGTDRAHNGVVVGSVDRGGWQVVLPGDVYGAPSWSPDGTRLAVALHPDDDARLDLVVVGANGRGVTTVAEDIFPESPSWSPRGDEIAYVRSEGDDHWGLYVVSPDGTGSRRVSDSAYYAWSPDGGRLAVSNTRLLVLPVAGGPARDLTPRGTSAVYFPAWSPDGRWIAFRDGGRGLHVVASDGSSSRRVATGDTNPTVGGPVWRPRGATPARLGGPPAPLGPPADAGSRNVLRTSGRVVALAADGGRVAAYVGWSRQDCDHVTAWKPGARPRHIGLQRPCTSPGERSDHFGGSLGLAGNRVAWVVADPSPSTSYSYLYEASVTTGAEGSVDLHADNFEDGIGDVHGDGNLLVFDTWFACPDEDAGSECGPGDGDPLHDPTLRNEQLWKVAGGTSVRLRKGPGAFEVMDVDAGRIAVLEPGGAVDVLRADGSLVHRIELPAGAALSARLSGSQLAVLTGTALRAYDAATGRMLRRFAASGDGGASTFDLDGGLAAWVDGRTVRVLRLADGHRASFTPGGTGDVLVQLQPSGLFTGYTVPRLKRPGRVVFTPRSELVRRLARGR